MVWPARGHTKTTEGLGTSLPLLSPSTFPSLTFNNSARKVFLFLISPSASSLFIHFPSGFSLSYVSLSILFSSSSFLPSLLPWLSFSHFFFVSLLHEYFPFPSPFSKTPTCLPIFLLHSFLYQYFAYIFLPFLPSSFFLSLYGINVPFYYYLSSLKANKSYFHFYKGEQTEDINQY